MLPMEKQSYLSNLSQFEGLSLREIAKRSGHHFDTVKKYVDKEDWNEGYKPRKERASLLEPLKSVIDGWIMEDLKRGRKYRRPRATNSELCGADGARVQPASASRRHRSGSCQRYTVWP